MPIEPTATSHASIADLPPAVIRAEIAMIVAQGLVRLRLRPKDNFCPESAVGLGFLAPQSVHGDPTDGSPEAP